MAEARQAVSFQFSIAEEGQLKFDYYSLEGIKVLFLSTWKSTCRKYIYFRNALFVGAFTTSTISLLLIALLLVAADYSDRVDVIEFCDRYMSYLPG